MFDGISDRLTDPSEIRVEYDRITEIGPSVHRSSGAHVIALSDQTVSPGFIDTHAHLTMEGANVARQTLESSVRKALNGLSRARIKRPPCSTKGNKALTSCACHITNKHRD